MDELSDIWIEQCEAARDIRDAWGIRKATGTHERQGESIDAEDAARWALGPCRQRRRAPSTWTKRTIDRPTVVIGAQPCSRRAHRPPQAFSIASS